MAPPKKPPELLHDQTLRIPLTKKQKQRIKRAARKSRAKHHVAWAREAVLRAVSEVLGE